MTIARFGTEQLTPRVVDEWTDMSQARFVEAGARFLIGETGGVRWSGQALAGWRACLCGPQGFTADVRGVAAAPFKLIGLEAFVEVQAGYRHGGRADRSELRLDGALGVRPRADVLLLAQLHGAVGRRAGTGPTARGSRAELSVVWDFHERWSVQAGVFTTLAGRNAAQESGGKIALWRRFGPIPQRPAQGF